MESINGEQINTQAARHPFFTVKNIIGLILLILLAAVFAFSGYSKMHSNNAFDNFQWTFIELGFNNQLVSGVLARLMIGMEFALALLLLAHMYLRQFTYKAVIGILAFFIVYLIIVIVKRGNTGDCGCFGDKWSMTPLQAIIKNVVMIGMTIVLMKIYDIKPYKYQEVIIPPVIALGFSLAFIFNPMYASTAPSPAKKSVELSLLYKYQPAPQADLMKGKHIIVFASYYCPHCRKAAYLLQKIQHEHPDYPIFLVMSGAPEQEQDFWTESHAKDLAHFYYPHTEEFMQLAPDGTPAIYWVNNGKVEYQSTYYQLDPKHMEEWLKGESWK
jgi:uncharacterized membrane protein YphA (DoxX/SURF4 family)